MADDSDASQKEDEAQDKIAFDAMMVAIKALPEVGVLYKKGQAPTAEQVDAALLAAVQTIIVCIDDAADDEDDDNPNLPQSTSAQESHKKAGG